MPFHTFVTVATADTFGHLYLLSAWKEILIAILALAAGLYCLAKPGILRTVDRRLLWLTGIYLLLQAVYVVADRAEFTVMASAAVNVRFLVIFWVAFIAGAGRREIAGKGAKVVLASSLIIAAIGLSLTMILPRTTLENFGYDRPGINTAGVPPAYHLVGDTDLVRAQSTLRGPNALGAFLILPISLMVFYKPAKRNTRLLKYGSLLLLVEALVFSYSRSAWLGASVVGIFWLAERHWPWIKRYAWQLTAAFVILTAGGFVSAQNDQIRTILLHETPQGQPSSNDGHWNALITGSRDVMNNPLGGGLGTAGAVSALSNEPAKISENYFLQIGQETGWAGLALLAAIHGVFLVEFYRLRSKRWVGPLLAAFVGLSLTNLLLHTWADESVALVFWGFAGLVYGSAIIEQKTIKNEKTSPKPSPRS